MEFFTLREASKNYHSSQDFLKSQKSEQEAKSKFNDYQTKQNAIADQIATTSLADRSCQKIEHAQNEALASSLTPIQEEFFKKVLTNYPSIQNNEHIDNFLDDLEAYIQENFGAGVKLQHTLNGRDSEGLTVLERLEIKALVLDGSLNSLLDKALVDFFKDKGVKSNPTTIGQYIQKQIKSSRTYEIKASNEDTLSKEYSCIHAKTEITLALASENQPAIDKVFGANAIFTGIVIHPKTGLPLCTGVFISENFFLTTGHYSIFNDTFIKEIEINLQYCEPKISTYATYICGGLSPENDFAIFRLKAGCLSPAPLHDKRYSSFSFKDNGSSLLSILDTAITQDLGPGCSGAPCFTMEGGLFAIHSYVDQDGTRWGPIMPEVFRYLFNYHESTFNELKEAHPDTVGHLNFTKLSEEDLNNSKQYSINPFTDEGFQEYKKRYTPLYWNYVYEVWTDKELLEGVESGSIRLNEMGHHQRERYERLKIAKDAGLDKENNEKKDFIENLKTLLESNIHNSNYDPLTESFKSKHFASRDSAKRNAQDRPFEQKTATKRSTLIEDEAIKRLDWVHEIQNALSHLQPQHLDVCGNTFRIRTGGRQRLLTKSVNVYNLKVNRITQSKGKKNVSPTEVLKDQNFTFGIQLNEAGLPQINHFSADGN
jgi:hypothetical protein